MRGLTAAALLLILSSTPALCAPAAGQNTDSPDGKLILGLIADGGAYEVTSVRAVPGVVPPAQADGNTVFRFRSGEGGLLHEGRVEIPAFIVHERADEKGNFFGFAEPFSGPLTVELPYFKGAANLELLREGETILARELESAWVLTAPPAASPGRRPPSTPPDFRGYLGELQRRLAEPFSPGELSVAPSDVHPAGKVRVRGSVRVKGVRDYSLIQTEIRFYLRGSTSQQSKTIYSGSDGTFSTRLRRGTYLVTARCWYNDPALGGQSVQLYPFPQVVSNFVPGGGGGDLELKWKLNTLFRGRLVAAGGSVQGEVYVLERKFTGSTFQPRYVALIATDEDGNFAVRLPRKFFAMVALPNPDQAVGEMLQVVKVRKSKKIVRLVCPSDRAVSGGDLKKIWNGGADQNTLNLIFLAEAYTAGLESFTDSNGNGRWDGDLLLDDDNDGNFDAGEYYHDRNRNGVYDQPESFVDANGDGICNRYERARFEADCAMNTAALLNFTPFDEYDDVVNVYTYWVASQHGTQAFTQYPQWADMNTAFDVYCAGTGGFQSGNISMDAKAYAGQLIPDANTLVPIVLVHDPLNVLRANAVFGFGRVLLSAEDHRAGAVLIHELGHSVGNLWDEYIYEGASGSPNSEPSAANATIETDPALVKWNEFFTGTPPVPTPPYYDGYGLFEGAGWYTEDVYRPTDYSMMRSTAYPFFAVNTKLMRQVLQSFR